MASDEPAIIRPVTETDLAAITRIYNQSVSLSASSWDLAPVTLDERRAWLRAHTRGRYQALVAEDAETGDILGFAAFGAFRAKEGYSETVEHSIYLDAAAQGRGLGTILLTELVDRARAAGFHALVGGLSSDNEVSFHLHRRLGFVEVGRLPQVGHKFGRWLDLVLLQLTLDDRAAPSD